MGCVLVFFVVRKRASIVAEEDRQTREWKKEGRASSCGKGAGATHGSGEETERERERERESGDRDRDRGGKGKDGDKDECCKEGKKERKREGE